MTTYISSWIEALTCKIALIIRGRESTCNCIDAPRRYRLIPCIIRLGANICWVHFSKIGCKMDVMPSLTSTCFEMSNTILLWFGSTWKKLKINMYTARNYFVKNTIHTLIEMVMISISSQFDNLIKFLWNGHFLVPIFRVCWYYFIAVDSFVDIKFFNKHCINFCLCNF